MLYNSANKLIIAIMCSFIPEITFNKEFNDYTSLDELIKIFNKKIEEFNRKYPGIRLSKWIYTGNLLSHYYEDKNIRISINNNSVFVCFYKTIVKPEGKPICLLIWDYGLDWDFKEPILRVSFLNNELLKEDYKLISILTKPCFSDVIELCQKNTTSLEFDSKVSNLAFALRLCLIDEAIKKCNKEINIADSLIRKDK